MSQYDKAILLGVLLHAIVMILLFGLGAWWIGRKCGDVSAQIKKFIDYESHKNG